MGESSIYPYLVFFLRWIHILAGITWIGLLYFFNFVNVPFQAVLEKEYKSKVNPPLLLRALWWFRWAAMVTMVVGWLLLFYKYSHMNLWFGPEGGFSSLALWILFGGTLGTIMWFNVWFIIWPTQKSILTGKYTAEQLPEARKKALFFSRVNSYLSGPMLFGMLAPSHYGAINPVTALVAIGLGLIAIWHALKFAPKVGTSA